MAGLVFAGTTEPLPGRRARRRPLRGRRAAAGDLVRRPRPAGDGQRRADRDVGAAVRGLGAVRRHRGARRRRRRAAAIAAGILLNLRYVPMGIALAPSLRGGPLRRAAIGQAMIDFSWAAASRGGGRFDPAFMVGATAPSYPCWVGGTAIGVFAGDLIGDPGGARARRDLPRLLPLPAGRGRAAPRPAAVVAALGSLDRPRPDPVHPAGRAGDRGLGRRPARPARRAPTRDRRRADERGLDHDRGPDGRDRVDPRLGPGAARRPRAARRAPRA